MTLPSHAVTLPTSTAASTTPAPRLLAGRLPETAGAERPIVVLRLRGRTQLGTPSLVVLDAYAERRGAIGGRLILSRTVPELVKQLRRTGRKHLDAEVSVFPATDVIGDSSDAAHREGSNGLPPAGDAGSMTRFIHSGRRRSGVAA